MRFLQHVLAGLAAGIVVFLCVLTSACIIVSRNRITDSLLFAQIAASTMALVGVFSCRWKVPARNHLTFAFGLILLIAIAIAIRLLNGVGQIPLVYAMYLALVIIALATASHVYKIGGRLLDVE